LAEAPEDSEKAGEEAEGKEAEVEAYAESPTRRKIRLGILVIAIVLLLIAAWGIFTKTNWISKWLYEPELEGHMEWIMEYPDEYIEFGGNRSTWTSYQVKKEDIELIFEPPKGTAKGVSILLELGEVDFTEANETWTEREGRYQWRFTTLNGPRAIKVTIMCPQLPAGLNQSTYDIKMFYAYTNEQEVSLDNQTLTVKLLD
jgi:hypothetical protein